MKNKTDSGCGVTGFQISGLFSLHMHLFSKKYGESGSNILILHGLFGMSDNWHNVAKSLSEQHVVYTLDLRNHGQSPHTSEMSLDLMAADVLQLMDEENIKECTLIGHSMGGKVSMRFAQMYPEKLHKLIVADIAPRAYPAGHSKYFEAMRSIRLDAPGRKEIEQELAQKIPHQGELLFLLKNLYRRADNQFALKLNLDAIEQHYSNLIGAIPDQLVYVPTCFIKGEWSNYITEADEIIIRNLFKRVEIRTVPNAGHWVHAENMSGFLFAVTGFMGTD